MSYLTHHTTALLQVYTRGKPKVKTNKQWSRQPAYHYVFPRPYLLTSISQIPIAATAPGPCRYTSHQVTGLGSGSVAAFPKSCSKALEDEHGGTRGDRAGILADLFPDTLPYLCSTPAHHSSLSPSGQPGFQLNVMKESWPQRCL